MPKTRILLAASILILASLACNALLPSAPAAGPTSTPVVIVEPTFPAQPGLPATEDEVPRVSLEQALLAHAADAAIFVDVRGPEDYASSHIPGAINIPWTEFENNIANVDLSKDDWIITYCT